ncbi:MAG: cobalamin biosynthesis protein CobW [Alphaproteobacteria bacterium]|jgi:cobalamin biosynthesis protein CobW|nr:cobalamin biosynthesis protein CobW [Alphaproteobacteria bacterium]HJP23238.1 cobalamin biosynthesis protein CobW [Alphaproteobacteria bacterium]
MTDVHKIPATVITGFLGAGKTSVIRHLLETANGRRLALIINEFGDIGVDSEVLKGCGIEACEEGDIVELANGCICCTVADDFLPTIKSLIDRPEPPDHIVIETSGLTLPKPLVRAFNWPEIRTRVTVDGVVAVVDGDAVAAGRFASDPEAVQAQREADDNLDHESPLEEVFEDQLLCADMVVLNKSDLLAADDLHLVNQELARDLRPAVKVVPASHGRIDAAILLGLTAAAEDDLDSRPSHHDDEDEHDHDDFETFSLDFDAVPEPQALVARLEPVIAAHDILRIKGFVAVEGKTMRLVVQAVGGRVQHYYDRDWRPGEGHTSRLVVIGQQGLDQAAISAAIIGRN